MLIKDPSGDEIYLLDPLTRREKVRKVILATAADFFTGMATAWAFAAYVSIHPLAWGDLLSSLLLAILSLTASISIQYKTV